MKISATEVRELEKGARHVNGVIACSGHSGFPRKAFDARMRHLVREGLAEPNAHGDFYITDKGREFLLRVYS